MREHFEIVQISKENQIFTVIDLLLVLLSLPILGLERISHIARLKTEQQAADAQFREAVIRARLADKMLIPEDGEMLSFLMMVG